MNTQACCTHSKITRITEDHPGGFSSEYWKCDTCETRFAPEPLMQGRVLRDWFAGMALQGMISNQGMIDVWPGVHGPKFSEEAYQVADAMIAQRDKHP